MTAPPDAFGHEPVLLEEVVGFLGPAPGKLIVDCTAGGAGHAIALAGRGARVLGLDRDPEAIEAARSRVAAAGLEGRVVLVEADFRDAVDVFGQFSAERADGVLLDLGVSSWQLDRPERGFSIRHDGPLDMRMSPSTLRSAADLVNGSDEIELRRILREYGEERHAGRIARAICRRRIESPILTTKALAGLVAAAAPGVSRIHPATRTFQALRIAVNDELGALDRLLEQVHAILRPGGRLAVISFHSLEDRIVKSRFRSASSAMLDRPEWPAPRPNPGCHYKLLTRRPVTPAPDEIARNPRARSARLRVAERRTNGPE